MADKKPIFRAAVNAFNVSIRERGTFRDISVKTVTIGFLRDIWQVRNTRRLT